MKYLNFAKGSTAPSTFSEKDDCAVRSITNTGVLTYEEAHCLCKEYGRKNGSGMYAVDFDKVLKALNVKEKYQFNTKYVDIGAKQVRGCSLKRFRDTCTPGAWIVMISGHYAAIVDNVIVDNNFLSGKARIIYAWRIN